MCINSICIAGFDSNHFLHITHISGGGTGGSEPPASRTLLSRFPYLYLPPPARFRAAPVPCKLAESKHILVLWLRNY